MNITRRLLLSAILAFPIALAPARQEPASSGPAPAQAPASLNELLEPIRAEFGLPALGGAIITTDGLGAIGAVGKRRVDQGTAVMVNDSWHLGSCTKSMTATWVALLVQKGELEWDTTIGDVYPELVEAGRVQADWVDVPIEWLLQNRAGAPADLNTDGLWMKLWAHGGTPAEQRRALVEGVLAHPPVAPPGTKYIYSNAGFSIAGAMAETILGDPWEQRIHADLFEPLEMRSAGFGAPGAPGAVLQPFGHRERNNELQPVALGPGDDNPSAIAPAGKVHAALADWAKYAALHLAGARGEKELLVSPENFALLHTPRKGDYAMGWVVKKMDWAGSLVLWHNGSNTMWYCEIAILPEKDVAVLVVSNRGDGRVRQGVSKALRALYDYAEMPAKSGR